MNYETTFSQYLKDQICYSIGDWYIKHKKTYIDWENKTNNLVEVSEDLKELIFKQNNTILSEEQKEFISEQINVWALFYEKNIACYKDGTHKLGSAKEHLKVMCCNLKRIRKMTQNRCRLFKAVMDTLPDTKEQKHFAMPWYNEKEMTKHSTKNLMKETRIRSPKFHKMKRITEEEPEILEYIERMTR